MRIRYGNDADPTWQGFFAKSFRSPQIPNNDNKQQEQQQKQHFPLPDLLAAATDKKDLAKKNCQTQMACPLNANDVSFKRKSPFSHYEKRI